MKYIPKGFAGLPTLVLSKRNILALLSKVDDAESMRTLIGAGFAVLVEPDEVHYQGRVPGAMSAKSEDFIKAHKP